MIRRYFSLRIAQLFGRRPYAAGVASTLLLLIGAASIAAASGHIRPMINGSVVYVNNTAQAIIEGIQLGGGIGVEGVTDTGSPAGAIALDGFGTSTTQASVGVNGSVNGPGSTALIGNANDTTGSPSIGLEGFSANGEGVFAQSTNAGFASLRSVDNSANYDVRLSDVPDGNTVTALLAASTGGAAVVGRDTFPSSDFNIGVLGVTATGLYGVEGTADGDALAGVFGLSGGTPIGVEGESISNNGVFGETFNASVTTSVSKFGVIGVDGSSDGGGLNVGVEGTSANATGVRGISTNGQGVIGSTGSNTGVLGEGQGTGAVGVWGFAPFGILGECTEPGGVQEFYGSDNGTNNFVINCAGVPSAVVRTRHNMFANPTFTKSTQSVLEDYGEAQLVNGAATVKLDPAFAETITGHSPYLVFVTPGGDTNGLYVTNKTLTSFDVREVRGGHSTLTFDYRIVAKLANDSMPRMALSATAPRSPGRLELQANERLRMQQSVSELAAIGRLNNDPMHMRKPGLGVATRREPKRLPIYEPRMGADHRLHPGQPYTPPTHPNN